MRWFYLLLLVLMAAAVAVFATHNPDPLTVRYPGGAVDATLPQLVAVTYLLGMVSGWTVLGLVRRTLWKATADSA